MQERPGSVEPSEELGKKPHGFSLPNLAITRENRKPGRYKKKQDSFQVRGKKKQQIKSTHAQTHTESSPLFAVEDCEHSCLGGDMCKLANTSYCRRKSQGSTDLPQTLKTSINTAEWTEYISKISYLPTDVHTCDYTLVIVTITKQFVSTYLVNNKRHARNPFSLTGTNLTGGLQWAE